MKLPILFTAFFLLLQPVWAQEVDSGASKDSSAIENAKVSADDLGLVSIDSKGSDVRSVLHDLFKQSKKNYVLEPNVRFVLFLSLSDVEFEEALQIVCKQASLAYERQNGIYYVTKKKSPVVESEPKNSEVIKTAPPVVQKPKGKLSPDVLLKKITTKFDRTALRKIFAELAKQTGIEIEVAEDVIDYKMDAHLVGTSLKYALELITEAAKLRYEFTDNKTLLIRPIEMSKVTLSKG